MIRPTMTYRMEVAWRGREDEGIKATEKVQYQAFLQATGAIQGSRRETVNQIAAAEDIRTKPYSMIARNLERPAVSRDIYPRTWSLIE